MKPEDKQFLDSPSHTAKAPTPAEGAVEPADSEIVGKDAGRFGSDEPVVDLETALRLERERNEARKYGSDAIGRLQESHGIIVADLRAQRPAGPSDGRRTFLRERIREYLTLGGLFNPEMMEHDKVRDLIMDLADLLDGEPPRANLAMEMRLKP